MTIRSTLARAVLPAAAALALASAPAAAQDAIRLGTSSVGSLFYTIAIGASELLQKHAKINTTVEPVGGSTATLHSLAAKKIEIGMANSFASFSAYYGRYKFKKPVDVRLVIKGQPNYRSLLVRKAAKIRTAADLRGKIIIGKRRALPENELVMRAMMKVLGLQEGSVQLVATTNSPQMYKALRAGSVDGAIVPYSPRSAALVKPMQDGVIEFFYLSKDKRDEAMQYVPKAFYKHTFKLGTFKDQKEPIYTFGLSTYLVSRPDISNETIYRATKAIAEHTKEFGTYHRAARLYTAKRTLDDFKLPIHEGAIRYFKEKGMWTAEHAKLQASLLNSR